MVRANQRIQSLVLLMICSFLLLGVGYAVINTTLNINGNVKVDKANWDVHFENIILNSNNTVQATPTLSNNDTTVSYSVRLKKPGDYYSFTVDAVNEGTMNAMISSITTRGLTNAQKEYIRYSITYEDGSEVKEKDALPIGERETLLVEVEFLYDIDTSSLSGTEETINLKLEANYVQDDGTGVKRVKGLYETIAAQGVLDNTTSDYVTSSTGIDFTQINSNSNGKGVYLKSETSSNTYPIYYYRGGVENNNVKFADFCWKIVRTTETGGVKLVYNGVPNGNGECNNTAASAVQISSTAFNPKHNSPAYVGYMYGTAYEYQTEPVDSNHIYGNSFTYSGGTYTLTSTQNGVDANHHYTCFNTTGTCSNLAYVYYIYNSNNYYVELTGGKSISNALEDMNINTNNSTIKTEVDTWFNNTFRTYFTTNSIDYNTYLEDTVWCNDRSINTLNVDGAGTYTNHAWNPNGGNLSNYIYYGAKGRILTGTPTLTCPNKNDAFTVSDTVNGNGALTYPVGLLTADEVMLAGGKEADINTTSSNTTYYLYTNDDQDWVIMSPEYFHFNSSYEYRMHIGYVFSKLTDGSTSFRPSISLKNNVKITSNSNGTSTNPYEIVIG